MNSRHTIQRNSCTQKVTEQDLIEVETHLLLLVRHLEHTHGLNGAVMLPAHVHARMWLLVSVATVARSIHLRRRLPIAHVQARQSVHELLALLLRAKQVQQLLAAVAERRGSAVAASTGVGRNVDVGAGRLAAAGSARALT